MKLPTSLALDLDLRNALDRLAANELRSRSWMVEKLLRESLAARAAQVGRNPALAASSDQPQRG
jgi:predicted transcriptional regulator